MCLPCSRSENRLTVRPCWCGTHHHQTSPEACRARRGNRADDLRQSLHDDDANITIAFQDVHAHIPLMTVGLQVDPTRRLTGSP